MPVPFIVCSALGLFLGNVVFTYARTKSVQDSLGVGVIATVLYVIFQVVRYSYFA